MSSDQPIICHDKENKITNKKENKSENCISTI